MIRERFDEIVAFAELEHAIDRPVQTYSSGMTMRLGFAIAAFLEADMLLLDEVFAVGDESFQRKCFGVIAAFKERGGTILFVSHDASAVERLCDRAVLLQDGRLAYDGPVHEAITRYRRALAEDAGTASANGRRPAGSGEARIADGAARRGRRASRATGSSRGSRSGWTSTLDRLRRRADAVPRGARRLRAARRRGRRRDRVARLGRIRGRRSRSGSTSTRRRSSSAGSTLDARSAWATTAGSSTGSRDPSRSSSTRTARAAGSCGSKERGGADRRMHP